jgi:hypothetical protein
MWATECVLMAVKTVSIDHAAQKSYRSFTSAKLAARAMKFIPTILIAILANLALANWAATGVVYADDWKSKCGEGAGNIKDEAMCAGRSAESLKGANEDYFRDMDYGATKNPDALAKTLAPYMPGITRRMRAPTTTG